MGLTTIYALVRKLRCVKNKIAYSLCNIFSNRNVDNVDLYLILLRTKYMITEKWQLTSKVK